MAGQLAVGVDLGGTKVAAGVFDSEGSRQGELAVRDALAAGPAEGTVDAICGVIESALGSAGLAITDVIGIGIGSPGPLDPRAGQILHTPNLPNLRGCRLCDSVRSRFDGAAVSMSNDGNCFALAEARVGAGRNRSIVLGVTLGTGCGIGVVINGQILEGPNASTGEVWRAQVGDRSYDDAVSGTGLERLWREHTGTEKGGEEISRLADGGDESALDVYRRFADQAALGLGNFSALLDPSIVVLGGSVAGAFSHFGERLNQEIRRYVSAPACDRLEVVPTKLGAGAGAIGAAGLMFSGGPLDAEGRI